MAIDPANGLGKIGQHRVVDGVETGRSIQHEVADAAGYLGVQSRKFAPMGFDFSVQDASPDGRVLTRRS